MNPCICEGNWRNIVKDTEQYLDQVYHNERDNKDYVFFGIVHGKDDYYYGMCELGNGKTVLLSCVGSMEHHGYTLKGPLVTAKPETDGYNI